MDVSKHGRRVGALALCSLLLAGAQCGHSGGETTSDDETTSESESGETEEAARKMKRADEASASSDSNDDSKGGDMEAKRTRVSDPEVDSKTLETLVRGNSTFGFDLYQRLRAERTNENVVYSPYNLSTVLAMLYAGAEGKTAKQMSRALHFELSQQQLHPAFNALDQSLQASVSTEPASRGELKPKGKKGEQETNGEKANKKKGDALHTAHAVWAQENYSIRDDYLDTLGAHYGSSVQSANFKTSAGEAAERINKWVREATADQIDELVSKDALGSKTRLVLTAAIYLRAQWKTTFDEKTTEEADFQTLGGDTTTVEMMHQKLRQGYGYAEGEQYRAVELPYRGNQLSMVVVLPDEGAFQKVEKKLDAEFASTIFDQISPSSVDLKLPKFDFSTKFSARSMLQQMGMKRAFSKSAEFGGISSETPPLMVSDVVHKARITVDETGTEAAAASGVTMEATSMPMQEPDYQKVTVDRPFMAMIRHRETDTVLFAGRIVDLGE
jgi:serpin B